MMGVCNNNVGMAQIHFWPRAVSVAAAVQPQLVLHIPPPRPQSVLPSMSADANTVSSKNLWEENMKIHLRIILEFIFLLLPIIEGMSIIIIMDFFRLILKKEKQTKKQVVLIDVIFKFQWKNSLDIEIQLQSKMMMSMHHSQSAPSQHSICDIS